jgi:hypothetical protein
MYLCFLCWFHFGEYLYAAQSAPVGAILRTNSQQVFRVMNRGVVSPYYMHLMSTDDFAAPTSCVNAEKKNIMFLLKIVAESVRFGFVRQLIDA